MDDKIQIPRLETPQTAHIRASYPTIEYLENGYIADWLKERQDQLLELAREERSGINANKLISGAVLTAGFFLHALSPLAPVGVVLGIVGYVHGCFVDANRTGSFSPLPFVRGNVLDLAGKIGNAELREAVTDEASEFDQLQHYLSPRERKEYEFINVHFALMTDYLTQVDPLKRFHAYRWIFDTYLQFKGTLPSNDQVIGHMANVAPDIRVNANHVQAIEQRRKEVEAKKPKIGIEYNPKILTNEQLYGSAEYVSNKLAPLPPAKNIDAPPVTVSTGFDVEKMNQNAWDILQSLVTDADKSKLGGCVILAAPGAGKTTYLGTAWGRLKQAYGERFTSLAIVVKKSDVAAFQGVSDNCLCVKDSPRLAAIAILRFISKSMAVDGSVRRLFLDDFLTMNEYFDAGLSGCYINPKSYEVFTSKKEDPDAQPLLKTLYTTLNELWLVGRQYNASLWVSSHSSNVDALPFVGSRESRSVGDIIFLAKNDKREFIEQAINNPNLIGDNIKRQEIKAALNNVKPETNEPLVLANFNNWTFGIVSNAVYDEYQTFRQEWETPTPTVSNGEKLSDVIQGLEKSLEISDNDIEEPILQTTSELSDIAQRLLSFFNNAKNKEPKSLADIKKKDELREYGDAKVAMALYELVVAEQVVFDGKDRWTKVGW